MKLSLIPETDARLKTVSDDWDFSVDGSPDELVKEMTRLMFLHQGIGLSAPQCGINKRVLIMGNQEDLVACINPKIISMSTNRVTSEEGCLSFPNLWMRISRPDSVQVSYQTIDGKEVEAELTGIKARVFLHEFDHLMGITFDERISKLKLQMGLKRRKKIEKRLNSLN